MPELCRFYGIIIKMFFVDIVQHNKPHIHAEYGDFKAVISLDGDMLAGSIPKKQFVMIQAWIAIHEEELYKAWNLAVRSEQPGKVEPLK